MVVALGAVFLEVVLPVALVAIAGGLVGHWRRIAAGPLSSLTFYLFTPSLVFHGLTTTSLTAERGLQVAAVLLAAFGVMFAAGSVWSILRGHDASLRAGFLLAVTTPNIGNMGLPMARLAFGQVGFDMAVVNFIFGTFLVNTGGVAIASMAGGFHPRALLTPFRFPALYAGIAGLAVNALHIELPVAIEAPIATLAGAAIPCMLVVLGLQLKQAAGRDHVPDTVAANIGRLLIGPVIGWLTATAVGLTGVERATLTVLAAMPTAVIVTIIATEFRAQPVFVTRVVVTSTLTSALTLTALITLVR